MTNLHYSTVSLGTSCFTSDHACRNPHRGPKLNVRGKISICGQVPQDPRFPFVRDAYSPDLVYLNMGPISHPRTMITYRRSIFIVYPVPRERWLQGIKLQPLPFITIKSKRTPHFRAHNIYHASKRGTSNLENSRSKCHGTLSKIDYFWSAPQLCIFSRVFDAIRGDNSASRRNLDNYKAGN